MNTWKHQILLEPVVSLIQWVQEVAMRWLQPELAATAQKKVVNDKDESMWQLATLDQDEWQWQQ